MALKQKLKLAKSEKRERIHSFHRYFGKLIPAIPKFAIEEFTKPGDTVCDITCGSGTTLVEAKLLGRNSYGVDINPLAVLISKTKTTFIASILLQEEKDKLFKRIGEDKGKDFDKELPFCINMDHWFKNFVQKDLVRIKRNIDKIQDKKIRDFFLVCFSAFLKGVSNADTHHIFPGYSKWLRKQDEEGNRKIDVIPSFEKAVNIRIKELINYDEKIPRKVFTKPIVGDARNLPKEIKDVDLIITNPPYISSIRYLETLKLEMFWMKYLLNAEDYHKFDKVLIGTEKFSNQDTQNYETNGIKDVDKITKKLFENGQKKMSKVVHDYFVDMEASFAEAYRVLNPGGHLVIKISDSFIRGFTIPTHRVFISTGENLGLKLEASFKDNILNRSLLTKRNSYSGLIPHDWILIFKK